MKDMKFIREISEEEKTPLVIRLLETTQCLQEQIRLLEDEIARLKDHKPKPRPKPSNLDKDTEKKKSGKKKKRKKKSKTGNLEIHEKIIIKPETEPPPESEFKGYEDYVVQDIVISGHNTVYRRERWKTPSGTYVVGKLPKEITTHFGPTLVSFVLYQYYSCHVTQPLICEQLREYGVDISTGQVSNIIVKNKDRFHWEKDQILSVGLRLSGHINVDDTGASHQGKGGFCTHIGNEWFAWFESAQSKTRINFLGLLRCGHTDYVLSEDAFEYMATHGLPACRLAKLGANIGMTFEDEGQWSSCLNILGIVSERHVRIATEGALVGSVIRHGLNRDLVVISDDGGQFNVFLHGLCWVHAERNIHRIVPFSDRHSEILDETRSDIWKLYGDLKEYRTNPNPEKKAELERRFDELFTRKTDFQTLNLALQRLHRNKSELLLVLDRPDIPLHNNLSESDIREYVKRRKISGSTRSDIGKKCRDTFTSLKKTCRKLGVSFWALLNDRSGRKNEIPLLPELMKSRMPCSNP